MSSRSTAFGLAALILYFAYHALAGEAGLGRWSDLQAELAAKSARLADLEAEIARQERDIARLTPETADPDLIEALARERLAYAYPDEWIVAQPE